MYVGESSQPPIEKLLDYRMHWSNHVAVCVLCLPSKWGQSVDSSQSPGQVPNDYYHIDCYMEAGKEPIQLWYGGLTPMRKGDFKPQRDG
jgi:hypothetical protein